MDKKKRLKKIKSLKKQEEIHEKKIEEYGGKKDHLIPYWKGEIKRFREERKEEEEKLKKK